jgi:hypothetical protein
MCNDACVSSLGVLVRVWPWSLRACFIMPFFNMRSKKQWWNPALNYKYFMYKLTGALFYIFYIFWCNRFWITKLWYVTYVYKFDATLSSKNPKPLTHFCKQYTNNRSAGWLPFCVDNLACASFLLCLPKLFRLTVRSVNLTSLLYFLRSEKLPNSYFLKLVVLHVM